MSNIPQQAPKKSSPVSDLNDLRIVWKIIANNWYVFVICLTIAFGISYLYNYKLNDIYGAKTQILLKGKENERQDEINQRIGAAWFWGNYTDYSDEADIIKSYDLVSKAVGKLNFDVSYHIVGRLKTVEQFNGLPFDIKLFSLPSSLYEKNIGLRIIDSKHCEFEIPGEDKSTTVIVPFDSLYASRYFQLRVNKNNMLSQSNIKSLSNIKYIVVFHSRSNIVKKYQSSIEVSIAAGKALMTVTLKDDLPQRAVAFLDTLAKIYIENSIVSRLAISENTVNYIDKQLDEVGQILDNIENDIEEFKRDKNIIDLDREKNSYFNDLSTNEEMKKTMENNLITLDELSSYLIENKDPSYLPPSYYMLQGEPFLTRNITQFYNLQMEKINMSYMATDANPASLRLDTQMVTVK